MSYNFVLNNKNLIGSSNNTFQYNFLGGSLTVPEGSEMGISQVTIPYSWYNISSTLGNNQLTYYIANSSSVQTAYSLTIPNGFYQVNDLNNYLQSQMKSNGHYWYSTQGTYSQQFQFTGNISSTTLTVDAAYRQVQLQIGYVITYIGTGGTSYVTATITSTSAAGVYGLSGSPVVAAAGTGFIAQLGSEITPTIIYPLNISVNTVNYTTTITSITIPTSANIQSVFGAGFSYADGKNGQPTWAGGYPSVGTTCAYLTFPVTNNTTTTIGNFLGFSSLGINTTNYPTLNTSIPSTTLTQSVNGNSLSASPPFPPQGSTVNGVIIRCNLIENTVGMPTDVLDSFPITTAFGSNINYLPISDNWIKLKSGKFSNLTISFVDQNLNPLPMQDPNVLITLLIRFTDKMNYRDAVSSFK